jgi:surface antigen
MIHSKRKESVTVLGTLAIIVALPIITLSSSTNLVALTDPGNALYTGNASKNNTYAYGYCTFWAAKRREDVGMAIPNNWGDAHTWDTGAIAAHYRVDHTPEKYAVVQTDAGSLGHVAFVEGVADDGKWTISQMNAPDWDIVNNRTYTAAQANNYTFIHDVIPDGGH